MSAMVVAYVITFTALLAAGAAAIEHGTRGRGAARHFWTVAIMLAVLAPCAALGRRAVSESSTTSIRRTDSGPPQLAAVVVNAGSHARLRDGFFLDIHSLLALLPSARTARNSLARFNRGFATVAIGAWATLSLSLGIWIVMGLLHWRRAQRTWRRTTLDGVSVDVSEVTGPAVIGFLSHRIVLPAWATTMEPAHRQLVLAHESEHIAARDPERLVLAIAALVLMPWNIGLWWCAARLRRAIELDCDTRVLRRFPGAKEYGYVLLEVASRGRNTGPLAVPMVALLRLPSELELRLRAMTRPHAAGTRGVIAGGLAAVIAIAAAFTAPVPTLALRSSVMAPKRTSTRADLHMIQSGVAADTGVKHPARIPIDQTVENDTLLAVERSLIEKLQYMPATPAWIDSTRAFLAGLKISEAMQQRALHFAEGIGPGSRNATYFEFQVEKRAAALPGSPSPLYPAEMRRAEIDGEVDAQFVVNATGKVDSGSVKITKSTNDLFTAAVKSALPKMRFNPAEIGGRKVRQLVQQPFKFSITH